MTRLQFNPISNISEMRTEDIVKVLRSGSLNDIQQQVYLRDLCMAGNKSALDLLYQVREPTSQTVSFVCLQLTPPLQQKFLLNLVKKNTRDYSGMLKRLISENSQLFSIALFNALYCTHKEITAHDEEEVLALLARFPELIEPLRELHNLPESLLPLVYPDLSDRFAQRKLQAIAITQKNQGALNWLVTNASELTNELVDYLAASCEVSVLNQLARHNDYALSKIIALHGITIDSFNFIFNDLSDASQQERLRRFASDLIGSHRDLLFYPVVVAHAPNEVFDGYMDERDLALRLALSSLATGVIHDNVAELLREQCRPFVSNTIILNNIREAVTNYGIAVVFITSRNMKRCINILKTAPSGDTEMVDKQIDALCKVPWKVDGLTSSDSHVAQQNILTLLQLARFDQTLRDQTYEDFKRAFTVGDEATQRRILRYTTCYLLSQPLTETNLAKLTHILSDHKQKIPFGGHLLEAVRITLKNLHSSSDKIQYAVLPVNYLRVIFDDEQFLAMCRHKMLKRHGDADEAKRAVAEYYLKIDSGFAAQWFGITESSKPPKAARGLHGDIIRARECSELSMFRLFCDESRAKRNATAFVNLLTFHVMNSGVGDKQYRLRNNEIIDTRGFYVKDANFIMLDIFGEFIRSDAAPQSDDQQHMLLTTEKELREDAQANKRGPYVTAGRPLTKRLRCGEVVSIAAKWEVARRSHVVQLSFFQLDGVTYLAYANRGARSTHTTKGGISFFCVENPELLDSPAFLNKLWLWGHESECRAYLEAVAPTTEDSLYKDLGLTAIAKIEKTDQHFGNCALACCNHAVLIQLIAKTLNQPGHAGVLTMDQVNAAYSKVKMLYKQFKHFSRKRSITNCVMLGDHTIERHMKKEQHERLLRHIVTYVAGKSGDSLESEPKNKYDLLEPIRKFLDTTYGATYTTREALIKASIDAIEPKPKAVIAPGT
ncbi:MAG: hypothetical protein P1U34_08465 [Coxiellaceae bacterium]|nr:hypothetical protein [Coxiellaceae bacterium]